jgi:hypothetical protein
LQVFVSSSKYRKKGKSHDPLNRGSRRMESEAEPPRANSDWNHTLYWGSQQLQGAMLSSGLFMASIFLVRTICPSQFQFF